MSTTSAARHLLCALWGVALAVSGSTAMALTYECAAKGYTNHLLDDGKVREFYSKAAMSHRFSITISGNAATVAGAWYPASNPSFEIVQHGGNGNGWILLKRVVGPAASPLHTVFIRDWGPETPGNGTFLFTYAMNTDILFGSCLKRR